MKKREEEAGCTLSPVQSIIVPLISKDISKVEGIVFEDHNADGIQDIGEIGLPDILVPAFERGDLITAIVIPIKYRWKNIERKHKLMIALYT